MFKYPSYTSFPTSILLAANASSPKWFTSAPNLNKFLLNGKSVNAKLPKGIYIVNGKKVMVK